MKLYFSKIKTTAFTFAVALLLFSCLPKENIVFKSVKNAAVEMDKDNQPLLRADALFYNPNKTTLKLREIDVDVFVEGKKAATVKQRLKIDIKPLSDFTVPLEANVSLKEIGLLDTVLSLFGGKKYSVEFDGYIKVALHGLPVKIRVKHKEEVRLKL